MLRSTHGARGMLHATENGISVTDMLTEPDLPGEHKPIGNLHSGFQSGFATLQRTSPGVLDGPPWTITLTEQFSTPPTVVVWLTGIDFHGHLSVVVSATDANSQGVTIQIEPPPDIILQSVGIAWVGYSTPINAITRASSVWKCPQFSEPRYYDLGTDSGRLVAVSAVEVAEGMSFTLEVGTGVVCRPQLAIPWEVRGGTKECRWIRWASDLR